MNGDEKIIPLFDRVLLCGINYTLDTGVLVPRDATDRSYIMSVTAIGTDVKSVKPGDTVIIAKYSGTECFLNSKKYLLVCEYDILGKQIKGDDND